MDAIIANVIIGFFTLSGVVVTNLMSTKSILRRVGKVEDKVDEVAKLEPRLAVVESASSDNAKDIHRNSDKLDKNTDRLGKNSERIAILESKIE